MDAVGALAAPVPAPASAPAAGLAGAPPPAPAARATAARIAPPAGPLAFDYSIHDGVLRVAPAVDGYLIVRAAMGTEASGEDRLMLRTSHVTRTSPLVLSIPEGAASLLLVLSARPVAEDSVGELAARAAPRTEMSATVSTPGSSRLEVRIHLK